MLHHALILLEEVARAGPGVTAKQLSTTLGLAPATTYRLVNLLVAEEYLVRLPDLRGFALGRRVIELADVVGVPRLTPAAAQTLRTLRSGIRLAVHLASYRHGRLRLLDPDPDHPPTAETILARHLHASALGKLLLSDGPPAVRTMKRLTPRTIADPDLLDRQLKVIRQEHIAYQFGELHPDRGCLAVPVLDSAQGLVAGLAISGSTQRIASLEATVLNRIRATAAELGHLLAP